MNTPRKLVASSIVALAMLTGCTSGEPTTGPTTQVGETASSAPTGASSPTNSAASTTPATSSEAATPDADLSQDPASTPLEEAKLDFTGLGPLQVGDSMEDLTAAGYVVYPDECGTYGESDALKSLGVEVGDANTGKLVDVFVVKPGVASVDGAEVGMTLAQLNDVYGSRLRLEGKLDQSSGSQVFVAVVQSDGNELVFSFDVGEAETPVDSDVVVRMLARVTSPNFTLDGC